MATDVSQLACVYAALILHDDGIAITADKISRLIAAAGIEVEGFWPTLFAKALEGKSIGDLLANVGGSSAVPAAAPAAAPAATGAASGSASAATGAAGAAKAPAPAKAEKKEEPAEDEDMGFSLFD